MESNPNSEEPARNWLELPEDVMTTILLKLSAIDILLNVQKVCSSWHRICKNPLLWRVVDMHNLGNLLDMDYDFEIMCMQAVDRSCGQLVDINIEYFGTDELLLHISQSSYQLRRLRVVYCFNISDEGLTEAVSKFPLLEHLEISECICPLETLETVGQCCPLLKSLNLNCQACRIEENECDEEALAIAENLPNLRSLQICGNPLTERGLQAILDGCPDLESLDLRRCFNLDVVGQLGIKCAKRIKNLHLPRDPIDDSRLAEIVGDDSDETLSIEFFGSDDDYDDDDDFEFSGGSDFSFTDLYFDI